MLYPFGCECDFDLKLFNVHQIITELLLPAVALSKPTLAVISDMAKISEGDQLSLICRVNGTPPVTFKLYRSDSENPLHVVNSDRDHMMYQIPVLSREDSGRYRCEAANLVSMVHSDAVDVQGEKMTDFLLRDLLYSI